MNTFFGSETNILLQPVICVPGSVGSAAVHTMSKLRYTHFILLIINLMHIYNNGRQSGSPFCI